MQGRVPRFLILAVAAAFAVPFAYATAQSHDHVTSDTTRIAAAETERTAAARPVPSAVQRAPADAAVDATRDGDSEAMLQQRHRVNQPRAMMIVGGAAFLAGAIIGGTAGTVLMVGGAIVGLVGLYDYLN